MAKMTHVEDMVIAVGEYQDPHSGETRYRNMTIGRVFLRENGTRVAKMTGMPVGEEAHYWNGFINFFEKREPQQQGNQNNQAQAQQPQQYQNNQARTQQPQQYQNNQAQAQQQPQQGYQNQQQGQQQVNQPNQQWQNNGNRN